jgi:phosphinothricin acetyltransferase
MVIRNITQADWPEIKAIFEDGIKTGDATLETSAPSWEFWNEVHLDFGRILTEENGLIIGWAALIPVSRRKAYEGAVEESVYIREGFRGKGIGSALMKELIRICEEKGVWTIQAVILRENEGSVRFHEQLGFRIVGYREKIGKQGSVWRDTVLMERRSRINGVI